MIQKVNPPPALDTWGSWSPESDYGRRYYSLEVVQNPVRARMCGFGDKDRRPLAPAAVVKMHVQRPDSTLVDVDEIDCSFFLVTVDLWSADGTKEMNLVLHPTSADRYTPASAPSKNKRRATTSSTAPPSQPTEPQSPVPPTPSSSQYTPQSAAMTPFIPAATPGYSQPSYPFPAQSTPVQEAGSYSAVSPYGQSAESSWTTYPTPASLERSSQSYGPPALPSIHTVGRNDQSGSMSESSTGDMGYSSTSPTAEPWQVNGSARDDTDPMPYRTWPAEQHTFSAMDNGSVSHGQEVLDPSLRAAQIQSPSSHTSTWSSTPVDPYGSRYNLVPVASQIQPVATSHNAQAQSHASPVETSMYASASYAQQQQVQQQAHAQGQYHQTTTFARESTPPSTIPPLPRHTYTRTLVGPLSANACRLLDEHRKPGIFFLFQDLSIRTEGTFRLRLRLMNVGALPAPDHRAYGVHNDVTPVLAQAFTEPFIVYSAKRFPGVPDTTALSIALGNQGQKLPLRNRNNKQGRKRQRNGSEESGDDSD